MNIKAIAVVAVTILITLTAVGGARSEQKPDAVRVFYFGNSLTGSSMPALHEQLGKSAGKQWTCDVTLDENLAQSAAFKPKAFLGGKWDAIVIQIFGSRLHHVTDSMWGSKFDGPVDVGDVAAASDIIRIFLKRNPQGKVFIYTVYAVAALFYAAIFEEKPDRLDFSSYNDPQKYGPDVHHDRGEILPITPERAKLVPETVWEVLQKRKTPATGN
ncbi:MAG: hypothetical protein MUF25_26645 [Pirellulaceae bacterium]|nr:hypothetical protein [Pirellulaceae bacterium]